MDTAFEVASHWTQVAEEGEEEEEGEEDSNFQTILAPAMFPVRGMLVKKMKGIVGH